MRSHKLSPWVRSWVIMRMVRPFSTSRRSKSSRPVGGQLAHLGRFYAQAIVRSGIRFDVLFGPAYKGIPLAAAAGIALADHHHRDVPWCFNRKEAKDHGEGGSLVGAQPKNASGNVSPSRSGTDVIV